jgi:hypothetical protein
METERPSPRFSAIDVWSPSEILDAMIEGQFAAVAAVHAARPAIERAALAVEQRSWMAAVWSMPVRAPRGAWRFRTGPS